MFKHACLPVYACLYMLACICLRMYACLCNIFSFDGGDSGISNRSVYPICVSVLNFDGADPLSCGLVGFIPAIDVPNGFKENERYRLARAHVLQSCIGAVVDVIEDVAINGFTAIVGDKMFRFHPFLAAVRVDTKERLSLIHI